MQIQDTIVHTTEDGGQIRLHEEVLTVVQPSCQGPTWSEVELPLNPAQGLALIRALMAAMRLDEADLTVTVGRRPAGGARPGPEAADQDEPTTMLTAGQLAAVLASVDPDALVVEGEYGGGIIGAHRDGLRTVEVFADPGAVAPQRLRKQEAAR